MSRVARTILTRGERVSRAMIRKGSTIRRSCYFPSLCVMEVAIVPFRTVRDPLLRARCTLIQSNTSKKRMIAMRVQGNGSVSTLPTLSQTRIVVYCAILSTRGALSLAKEVTKIRAFLVNKFGTMSGSAT